MMFLIMFCNENINKYYMKCIKFFKIVINGNLVCWFLKWSYKYLYLCWKINFYDLMYVIFYL